jgi:hypothetical protein
MLVKFPYSASRRIFARRPRRSKNGTPEERAAAQAAETATTEPAHKQRRSKNGTPEQRAAKVAACTVIELQRGTAPAVAKTALAELFKPSAA